MRISKIGVRALKYFLISPKPLKSLKFITERYLKAEKYKKKRRRHPFMIKTRIKVFPDY